MQIYKKNHPICDWIEGNLKCSNRVARFAGKPVRLLQWQKDIIWKVWPKKKQRTIEEVLIDTARKTGKTEFLAYIICCLLFSEDCPDPWPVHWKHSSATLLQSKIIFQMLKSIIINSRLKADIKEQGEIYPKDNENSFEILSGRDNSKQGLNFSHASNDEADQTDLNTIQLLEGGMAMADCPLMFYLTNAPEDQSSWIKQKIDYAREIKQGKRKVDKRFLGIIYETKRKEAEDFKNPAVWKKANPSLGYLVKESWYEKQLKGIEQMPAKLVNFKRLHLGFHSYQTDANWISPELIKPMPKDIKQNELVWYGGIDLSTSKDLTSFCLVSEDTQGNLYVKNYNWIPRAKLIQRQDRDAKVVDQFLKGKEKNLFISKSETINLQSVENKIMEIQETEGLTLDRIGVDRVKHAVFSKEFSNTFELLSFSQQPTQFTSPILYFEDKILKGKVYLEDNNRLFRWSMSNVRLQDDLKSPVRMFYKKKSREAIDPLVACVMGVGVLLKYNKSEGFPKLWKL